MWYIETLCVVQGNIVHFHGNAEYCHENAVWCMEMQCVDMGMWVAHYLAGLYDLQVIYQETH